jgi:hypothetical protein
MATLAAIRDGIKDTIEANVTGLRVYDVVEDVTLPPAVVVLPAEADFDVAMGRGTDTWTFDRQVIFNNKTLGLSDVNAHISGMSRYGAEFEAAGVEHIGAVLRLIVHTTGTA